LQIKAPVYGILKALPRLLQDGYRFGIRYSLELRTGDAFERPPDLFVDPLPEEIHFICTFFECIPKEKLEKIFSQIHVVF
jgi:hypothetical protein